MRTLPPLDERWRPVTARGEEAIRIAIAIDKHGWTEERVARALGLSLPQVRRLRYRAKQIFRVIVNDEYRRCWVCGKRLAADARKDARYCFKPSTCREKGRRMWRLARRKRRKPA